jgi:hypothetical protein
MAAMGFSVFTLLAGQVKGPDGEPVAGARVELVQPPNDQLLGDAVSVSDGSYRLILFPELDLAAFQSADLVVRAVDARGQVLAERPGVTLRAADTLILDLDVPAGQLADFEPVASRLDRAGGPLLDEGALRTVEAAIAGLASVDEHVRDEYLKAVHRQLPELATFPTVAEDAWGVLDGDPEAAERFRTTLARYDRGSLGTIETVFGLGPDLRPRFRLGGPPLPHPRHCGLPLPKFGLVTAAALMISESAEDAFLRLGELEFGLAGLRDFEALLNDAFLALAGDDVRFRDSLDRLSSKPFPPPVWEPPFAVLGVCEILRRGCAADLVSRLKRPWVTGVGPQRPVGPSYLITSVTPSDACPGSTVVIKGVNFGTVGGRVCFPAGISGRICVAATTWTDTEVQAVVPPEAGAGMLTLQILDHTVGSCDGAMEIYRQGTGVAFGGGTGRVLSVSVDGRSDKVCVEPARPATVAWTTTPAGNVAVRLQIQSGLNVLVDQSGLPATGSIAFSTPAVTTPSTFTVTVTAANACGQDTRSLLVHVDVVPKIMVEGMEVTQGIQTFWRSGATDNSLPVIAGKDTIVRVYVSADRKGFNNDQVQNAVVTLDVDGLTLFPINGVTPTNPSGSTPLLTIRRRADILRATTNHTFNFRIPAYMCGGTRSLFAFVVAGACWGNQTTIASRLQQVTWQVEPPLRVRFVRLRDNRPAPAGTGALPTEDQARFTVIRAFDLLPTPPTDIAPAITATMDTTQDFTTLAGLKSLLSDVDSNHDTWEFLFSFLGITATPAQDHAFWIALTTPFNQGLAGRPGNTCVAAIYTDAMGQGAIQRVTPAHEIAHNLEFMHVNQVCGTQTILGPFYAHPNNGTLLDVPFDPYWNQALGGTVQDFMSYGCSVWTSDDSWTRLQGAI